MKKREGFEAAFLQVLVDLKYITPQDSVQLLVTYDESDVDQFDDFLLSEGILEQEELLLRGVPVRADALEAPRPVVQGVRHRSEVHFVVAHDLAVEEHPAIGVAGARAGARGKVSLHQRSPRGV